MYRGERRTHVDSMKKAAQRRLLLERRLLSLHQESHTEFPRQHAAKALERQPAAEPSNAAMAVRDVERHRQFPNTARDSRSCWRVLR